MNVIGTSEAGNPIVELDAEFRNGVLLAVALLSKLPVMTTKQAEAFKPDEPAPIAEAPKSATAKPPTCIQCGKPFISRRVDQTCCSKACRRKIHAPRHPALSREKTCAICGKAFTDESITNSLKTCSPECQLALKRQTKNRLRGGPAVTRKQAAPVKLARAGTIDRRQMLIDAAKRVGLITEAGSREVEK